MNDNTKRLVREHIMIAMERKIHALTVTRPFVENDVEFKNPFGYRIVPIEVWKGSKFERSFVTTLGQGIFEQLGKIIAQGTGAHVENQYRKVVTLNTFQIQSIEQSLERQGQARRRTTPDIAQEIEELNRLIIDSNVNVTVINDLYIRRQDGQEEFYSLKTVKPNKDTTIAAKKCLLYLKLGVPACEAYFALPFNPAGDGHSYIEQDHKMPCKWFSMDDTNYVLIGSALWNKIGADPDTYNELLEIFAEVGIITRNRIRTEYFGLQP